MRAQNAAARPFDVGQLEGDIQEAIHQRPPHIQPVEPPLPRAPTPTPPVPDYVSHREDVSEIGKLSAEAIVREYELTAKEIEAMGEMVRDMVKRCEQLATSASSALRDITATAQQCRREGKRIFNEIESCSSATDEIRRMCESFRDKISTKVVEKA
jgi:hypothetical protein